MEIVSPNDFQIDWKKLPEEKTGGISGFALSKTQKTDKMQIRFIRFSGNYEADHWCTKGHLIFVRKGVLFIDFQNGDLFKIEEGNSCVLGENKVPHKARTKNPAEIWIID